MRKLELQGERFGRLVVLSESVLSTGRTVKWNCSCDCGTQTVVTTRSLRSGNTKSCGCYSRDVTSLVKTTHGQSKSRLYRIWRAMKDRCLSPRNKRYAQYGGKGVRVCEQWINSFENFRDWATNNNYNDSLSIDRKDVNGNYQPGNCRWETDTNQANNKSNNVIILYNGESKSMTEWSRCMNINYSTLRARRRSGKTKDELFVSVGR